MDRQEPSPSVYAPDAVLAAHWALDLSNGPDRGGDSRRRSVQARHFASRPPAPCPWHRRSLLLYHCFANERSYRLSNIGRVGPVIERICPCRSTAAGRDAVPTPSDSQGAAPTCPESIGGWFLGNTRVDRSR